MLNEKHGIWRIIPSMSLTEIIGQSGFDFQILDCEHGGYDFGTLETDIRTCHLQNCLAYVRVSGLNKVEVQRCLDLGADGIVFPQLNDLKDFLLASTMLLYPPSGIRGFNPFVPAGGYGFKKVNEDQTNYIAIIETLNAVNQLDDILKIKNLNTIYIGVYDLSAQLNCIGDMNAPILLEMVEKIVKQTIQTGKAVALMINSPENYSHYKNMGVTNFVHTIEGHQIKKAFLNELAKTKNINNA